jgi:excisionase family DNA binding protein
MARHLLRIKQAREYLNNVISEKTLRDWIWRGKVETVRVGRCVCICADSLDAMVARGTMPIRTASTKPAGEARL